MATRFSFAFGRHHVVSTHICLGVSGMCNSLPSDVNAAEWMTVPTSSRQGKKRRADVHQVRKGNPATPTTLCIVGTTKFGSSFYWLESLLSL